MNQISELSVWSLVTITGNHPFSIKTQGTITMKKIILSAAFVEATFSAANAGTSENGLRFNGLQLNGLHVNGFKVVKGNDGAVPIDIPRDRDGSFEPELIRKGQARIDGMDDKIIHCPAGDCTAICREGGFMRLACRPATSAPIWRMFMA